MTTTHPIPSVPPQITPFLYDEIKLYLFDCYYVTDPPYFPSGSITRLDIIEGDWALLNLTALANPANITYSWFFSGQRLILGKFKRDIPILKFLQNGALLNLTDVKRTDAGTYLCEAKNAEGNVTHNVTFNVLCKFNIVFPFIFIKHLTTTFIKHF